MFDRTIRKPGIPAKWSRLPHSHECLAGFGNVRYAKILPCLLNHQENKK